jgi:class 3 adenylate cyclase/TolB-like protein/cytochrome c-type biogenesis protein CcmH/NrfG
MPPAVATIKRYLATVLAADAVGFSQRMRQNAQAAVTALFECRAVMTEVVEAFHGSIVGTPGDFFLALMPSGLQAAEAALEMQRRLAARNLAVEEPMRVHYRIGIGIGDVYENGCDVLGDAVNVASRLQSIATPGSVLASAAVREAVGQQSSFIFEDLGDRDLKNIAGTVRVYAVVDHLSDDLSPVISRKLDRQDRDEEKPFEVAERLPIKPVVEIETFRAVGNTGEDRMFADGLADELLAMLAGLANSLVVRQVASEQIQTAATSTVRRYRLSGSIRRNSAGARIIAYLTEAGSGNAIWADRFDYNIDQSFDAHEVIAREVVTALQVNLTEGEQAQLWNHGTTNIRAWELFQRGHDLERRFTRHGHREACRCYANALRHDQQFVSAIVALAFCHLDEIRLGWTESDDRSFAEAKALYDQAIAVNPDHAECHALKAYIDLHQRNDAAAVTAMEKAARLSPRSGELAAYLGNIYDTVGRYDEAIIAYRRAMWLTQHFPPWIASNLGLTLCVTGRAEEARKLLLGVITHHPDYSRAHLCLAIAYARLGQLEAAKTATAELQRLDSLFTIDDWARNRPYADPQVMAGLVENMRMVGLR